MADRKTLAELKAAYVERGGKPRTWGEHYTLDLEYAVGQAGRKRTGTLVHLLVLDRIIADTNPTPGWKEHNGNRFRVMKQGDIFGSHAICGTRSNGQHTTGAVSKGDTDQVNCQRCLDKLGWTAPEAK